jgi:hypothetical protein
VKNTLILSLLLAVLFVLSGFWGFFGHRNINRHAIFLLPSEMLGFYKHHHKKITDWSVNADKRRFTVVDEAARHYIDLDHYGDSAWFTMPRFWKQAVERYSEDTLKRYGIIPWHLVVVHQRLTHAMQVGDVDKILRLSADLGHYVGDAHVPLHTTKNYNGQLTGQEGIHAFWESRLPELFSTDYNFLIPKATYVENVQLKVWEAIIQSHQLLDSVLLIEKRLERDFKGQKFSFETKGRQTVKVYERSYSEAYHRALNGMVEQRMRDAIKLTADLWYTAWINAGQPDLHTLIHQIPTSEEIEEKAEAVKKLNSHVIRDHAE